MQTLFNDGVGNSNENDNDNDYVDIVDSEDKRQFV